MGCFIHFVSMIMVLAYVRAVSLIFLYVNGWMGNLEFNDSGWFLYYIANLNEEFLDFNYIDLQKKWLGFGGSLGTEKRCHRYLLSLIFICPFVSLSVRLSTSLLTPLSYKSIRSQQKWSNWWGVFQCVEIPIQQATTNCCYFIN